MLHLTAMALLAAAPQDTRPAGIADLEAAVRRNPSNASAWKDLGMAMVARRRAEPALEAFSRACELDPKDEDACYYLGRQLFSLDRYQEAVAPFEKALRAAPREKLARTHRAAALNRIGHGSLDQAELHFREAVQEGHGPPEIRAEAETDYGAFLFRQARANEALTALEAAVKINPGSARAHGEFGRVLLHLGKTPEAATALEQAVRLDGRSHGWRLLLGRAYLTLGRSEDGEHQLRLAREEWERNSASPSVK